MKIIVSENGGFCGGVKAAVLRLRRAIRNNPERKIKVFGELVHNPQVNQEFIDQGVEFISSIEEAKAGDLVVIRAHGTSADTYKYLNNKDIEYIDATCHKVKKTQERIKDLEAEGFQVAIFGEENHPETQALLGHTNNGFVINNNLLENIQAQEKVALICQSTANHKEFEVVCQFLEGKVAELKVLPSFCDFTLDAQRETRSIRERSDLMLVVGGKNSSNTIRLFEIASETKPAFHIQKPEQINMNWLIGKETVGISAGASTPTEVIDKVVAQINEFSI